MRSWLTVTSLISLSLAAAGAVFLPAQANLQANPQVNLQASEAKTIEQLKNLAARQPAIAPTLGMGIAPNLAALEEGDKYLYNAVKSLRLVLKLGDRRVLVYEDNVVKASYPVAVGKAGWETPKGKFKVIRLERNPTWQSPWTNQIVAPGDNNPIGARWVGFWTNGKDEIGFHGTPNEGSIGQAASHGCVRMLNRDIKAMFELVSMGMPVEVLP